ncbi:MAG: hypothetical protein C0506_10415 [Anaerolinea sp.]|nr:hypothetical protein [Anaerolinea sp.]
MGLVAQFPIDTLFAPPAAMPGAATAADTAAPADLFAALLASLSGETDSDATAAGTVSAPPVAAPPEKEPGTGDDTVSAAVAALQLFPQLPELPAIAPGPLDGGQSQATAETVTVPVATPASGAAAEPVGTTGQAEGEASASTATAAPPTEGAQTTRAEEAAAVARATPQREVDPQRATPATPAVAASEGTLAGPATPARPATPATAAGEGTPATAATPATPATPAGLAIEVVAANRVRRDERKAEREEDGPPAPVETPPEAPPEGQALTGSVVRFDGNATDSQGQRNGQGESRKGDNQPNASAQGIAHAAANSAVGELRAAETTPVAEVPQPEPPTPALPEAVQHVGRTIIERVEQGGGEARLHLRPEALGEVTLHIHTDGDQVRVEIRAERAEAANLLRDHIGDLSQLLGSRGLNLADVQVGLGWQAGEDQQNDQPGWARRRAEAEDSSFAGLMGLDEPGAAGRHNRLRSAYNPDGALSYRV